MYIYFLVFLADINERSFISFDVPVVIDERSLILLVDDATRSYFIYVIIES